MTSSAQPDPEARSRSASSLWDTLIRIGLIVGLGALCFQVLSPFLRLIFWSIILAVTIYPLHQWLARRLGGRPKLASAAVVLVGVLLIVVPTWLLMNSFGDSIQRFVGAIQENRLQIPAPREAVKSWPLVGHKIHELWSKANADLPGLVQTMRPKMGDLARDALSMVASLGRGMLLFLASFLIGSIVMAYGNPATRAGRAIFTRLAGPSRGEALAKLTIATLRSVAMGVIGVAAIQALLLGLAAMLAGIRVAGVLAIVALVLGIAQVPLALLTLPIIVYIWASGDYSTGAAITHTIILLFAGLVDNILKPMMLGRGVEVPMPVILFGALGGMVSGGILGMFVGATVLALGYELVTHWVAGPDSDPT